MILFILEVVCIHHMLQLDGEYHQSKVVQSGNLIYYLAYPGEDANIRLLKCNITN